MTTASFQEVFVLLEKPLYIYRCNIPNFQKRKFEHVFQVPPDFVFYTHIFLKKALQMCGLHHCRLELTQILKCIIARHSWHTLGNFPIPPLTSAAPAAAPPADQNLRGLVTRVQLPPCQAALLLSLRF